jgi:hypothetical protein
VKSALALLVLAGMAHADASPPVASVRAPIVLGALHCDGVEHHFTVEVEPGETVFLWRGDRACEGAEASAAPLEALPRKAIRSTSNYDGGRGEVRLVLTNRAGHRVRLKLTLFGAYA